MNIKLAALALIVGVTLTACRPDRPPDRFSDLSQTERELLRDWAAPGLTPTARAEILNRFFTNGTPVATIVRVLGPNYIRVTPYSMVSLDGHSVMCYLAYTNQRVTIGTSARVGSGEDPLAAAFTGAGYELDVLPATNKPPALR